MNLPKELAKQAKKKGICEEWYNQLKSLNDKDAMADMYLRGIDFCLRNDYPSNDFIQKHFGDVAPKHGVFVDAAVDVTNRPKCVCLGACSGRVKVDGFNVCEVFVKHDSELNIIVKDNAFVMVDIFDNANVMIHAYDRAKVCVKRYGGNVIDNAADDAVVKLREKNKKTY